MRLGLFAHRLAQGTSTGVGRYVRELSSALVEAAGPGDSVVIASTPEREQPTWVPAAAQLRGVPWPRRLASAAWCLGGGPRIESGLGTVDVVHLLYPFPPGRTAAPQLVTVHDLFPFEHPESYPRSERVIFRRTITLTTRRARRIVVPSAYVARSMETILGVDPDRVAVVGHGVSGAFSEAGTAADVEATCTRFGVEPGQFVVCVGVVEARKNLIPLIRAMGELRESGIPLLIVGRDGHRVAETEAEIARLDRGVQIRRTGYLLDQEVAALVKSATVLVHPSPAEGFGFVPLEAMAVGTPVIAARASSVPEVVADAGILVEEPMQPKGWADALSDVIGSPTRRDELAVAGRQRAATFTWQKSARTMFDLYRDVAGC
jgi:glycosyltransferase involved in cell wall biosynthesis